MKYAMGMKRFTEKESVNFKGGQGVSVTGFMLLNILSLCAADFSGANPTTNVQTHSVQIWNFDIEKAGTLPPNFMVGTLVDGRVAGKWQVINMKTSLSLLDWLNRAEHTRINEVLQTHEAPSSPHVLAQLNHKAFVQDFNVLLIDEIPKSDFDLQVSFLPVAGKADMGGGLIWHARDHRNYYITRANPLEQNIRFYRVVNGVRHMLANFDHIISVKSWHNLQVLVRGHRFHILMDEQ